MRSRLGVRWDRTCRSQPGCSSRAALSHPAGREEGLRHEKDGICAVSRPCRAAMPTGGRRSKPSPRFYSGGGTRFRGPAGPRCRPEVGVPSRPRASARAAVCGFAALPGRGAGRRPAFQAVPALLLGRRYAVSRPCRAAAPTGSRRSKPSPRFCSGGGTVVRPATRGYAGLKTGVPFPAAPSNPAAFRAPRPCRAAVPTEGRRLLTGGIRMVGVPGGPAFTQRLARVYFDRSATMSDAKRRGSAGMRRRPNAASRCPSAAKLTRLSGERLPESTVAQWQSSGLLIRWL